MCRSLCCQWYRLAPKSKPITALSRESEQALEINKYLGACVADLALVCTHFKTRIVENHGRVQSVL